MEFSLRRDNPSDGVSAGDSAACCCDAIILPTKILGSILY